MKSGTFHLELILIRTLLATLTNFSTNNKLKVIACMENQGHETKS